MKPHYLRYAFDENFLVPEEVIEDFDRLRENEDDEVSCDEFVDKYWQYKREGELYDIKLFIED